jgi:hypothetical protein
LILSAILIATAAHRGLEDHAASTDRTVFMDNAAPDRATGTVAVAPIVTAESRARHGEWPC